MENINKKNKPPYLLGLLCLIPLVGAFVGIALLLYGLLKYKDKWLSIIGVFGIVFTIVVYTSLFHFVFDSNFSKKQNVLATKRRLNELIKNIEFYKLVTGQYPDSLQQIIAFDSTVIIYDFLTKNKHDIVFNYTKINNNYSVWSSGLDGLSNTKDDIYPSIKIPDSSRIGLIKNEPIKK